MLQCATAPRSNSGDANFGQLNKAYTPLVHISNNFILVVIYVYICANRFIKEDTTM
jgi:hypothetical protein